MSWISYFKTVNVLGFPNQYYVVFTYYFRLRLFGAALQITWSKRYNGAQLTKAIFGG